MYCPPQSCHPVFTSTRGITAFEVQYWNGSSWATVSGGSVSGNNKVWRQFGFDSVTTSKIRLLVNDSADHIYSRVVEVEAWEPANQSPVANPGGPYSGLSGSYIQVNGSGSYDPYGTVINYQWNFGDNTTGSGSAPGHVNSSIGAYTVTLTVTDNNGASATTTTTITATSPSNQLPVANPGGPYTAVVGTALQFNGAGSYDPDGTIADYHWEFADGAGTGATPTHTFSASGSHLVSLTVTDNAGAKASASIVVKVAKPGGAQIESAPDDDDWNPRNRDSLDDPGNSRGNPANNAQGNNNFQFAAPLLSLPGRGLDLNLNLVYNSLVWNKSGSEITFDIDHDWPAPGWQLGFGKMIAMGTAGAMMVEPDGTRHGFTGTVFNDVYSGPGFFGVIPTSRAGLQMVA